MADHLLVHVGLAKTGTTALQRSLAEHRPGLRAHGWLYPFIRPEAQFHAALELREDGERFGFTEADLAGTWTAITQRCAEHPGSGLLSHELLAGLNVAQVRRLHDDLAAVSDREPDLVITVRDPARQLMAHWSEAIKNGADLSFAAFEAQVLGTAPDQTWFRAEQDLLDVLGRFGQVFEPSRIRVVIGAPSGAEPVVLWRRFGAAVGLPQAVLDDVAASGQWAQSEESGVRAGENRSLSASQLALLREVNRELAPRLPRRQFLHASKRYFAQEVLARTQGQPLLCPERLSEWAHGVARQWQEALRIGGYAVTGDLADLTPQRFGVGDPDQIKIKQHRALPQVLAALIVERSKALQTAAEEPTRRPTS